MSTHYNTASPCTPTSCPLATSHQSQPDIPDPDALSPLPLGSSSHSTPTAGPSTMATPKAFPHNADLLGATSEVSTRARPLHESPPRIRRRTSLRDSLVDPPDFDNYPRGSINSLGTITHLRRPVISFQDVPVTAPRQVSSNRRIPPIPQPHLQPLSQMLAMYGNTGEMIAGNEASPVSVPPPRSRDDTLNSSPEREAMTRSTSFGTAFRHRMLRERMARLDALRTMPSEGFGLFGAPTMMDMDVDGWNQGVQDALARRTSPRRHRDAPYSRQADSLWGEITIPVDTATSGFHDIFNPRGPLVPSERRYRLPRAYEQPERAPFRWSGPDTESNPPTGARPAEFDALQTPPSNLLGGYRRFGTDSGSTDTLRSFRPEMPSRQRWASYNEEDRRQTNLHAPLFRQMHLNPDMPIEEKLLMARAVCRGMSRWPIEIRRRTAEEMIEKVQWGKMGVREGMERDEYCSICHDEYVDTTPVAVTPCMHMYHHACLNTWLHTANTSSCPMCRRDLAVLAILRKMVPRGDNEIMNLVTGEVDKSGREAEAMTIWMAL